MTMNLRFHFLIILFGSIQLVSFAQTKAKPNPAEIREDSIAWIEALKKQKSFPQQLHAVEETRPVVTANIHDDAADDPAIWINKKNPERSLILGTNKKAGLYVYNLKGDQLQFVKAGRLNNVDLREGFIFQGKERILVAASNRSINAISLFIIDPVTGVLSDTIANLPSQVGEVYGLCMYHNQKKNEFFVIVNGKDGKFEEWHIQNKVSGIIAQKTRIFHVNTQPEGLVADDFTGSLFVGVEDEGIYQASLYKDSINLEKMLGSDEKNPAICYDLEGLALFRHHRKTYLIASSQGNFSYALFNPQNKPSYLGSFVITEGPIDGVEETDGLEVTIQSGGRSFPHGFLVVQDGKNMDQNEEQPQNFKLVRLEDILEIIKACEK